MTDGDVVIVDAQGTEHVFPPGMDPAKAAAIVRAQQGHAIGPDTSRVPPGATGGMLPPSTAEPTSMLGRMAEAATLASSPETQRGQAEGARDLTLGALSAVPFTVSTPKSDLGEMGAVLGNIGLSVPVGMGATSVVRASGRAIAPHVGAALVRVGQSLESPLAGGLAGATLGGLAGLEAGGPRGALAGAVSGGATGAAYGVPVGRIAKKIGSRIMPAMATPAPIPMPRAAQVSTSPRASGGMDMAALGKIGASHADDLAASQRLLNGLSEMNPNRGGTLTGGETIDDAVSAAVDSLRREPIRTAPGIVAKAPNLSHRRGLDIVTDAQTAIMSPEQFAAARNRLLALGVPEDRILYYMNNPASAQGLVSAGGVGRLPRR